MAGFKVLTPLRHWLLAAACLAPLLACAQTALDQRIAAIRERGHFVPDKALLELQQIETEARNAPLATRAEFISQLSITRMRLGQNDTALLLADELITYATAHKDNAALAKGLLTKGYVKFAMTDPKTSHRLAFEAEKLAMTGGDVDLQVRATIAAGESWAEEGNYPAALAKLQRAVTLARQGASLEALSSALNSLTVLYMQMKEYDKGFEALNESLAVAGQLHSDGRLALAKSTEYGLAIESKQPKRALKALLDELALERKLEATGMVANTLVNLSDNYLKQYDYPKTIEYANQAIASAKLLNDPSVEGTARVNIGEALIGMGRVAEGKLSFESGMRFFEKAASKPDTQAILLEYGTALERAGDFAGAVAAYHRERAISNEMFEKERQKSVYDMQEKYETEKKQRQIELLSRENQVKSAEIDNRRLQQRVWWLLAVVFALAAVIVGLLYRKVRHANVQLEVKNLELKQQSSRDPLTALYNRRHFQDFMRTHDAVEKRAPGNPGEDLVGALFLLDVDHFKHVNDVHGHAAGDAVLKMIAANLNVLLRETDMIVRWGGEEFLAFLPAIPRSGIEEVARRILHGISAQSVEHQGRRISVNVSLGFAPFPLVPLDTPLPWERVVNLIDMALYLAKAHGRNRAYGVRGFGNFERTSMEAVEQDLELAWRAGFVDLSIVLGATPEPPPPTAEHSNVVALKPARQAGS
ncbi:diguanylate cyclase (GGDEF)-like protein [Oxalobacteraceae bacterium GrIS 1.11]